MPLHWIFFIASMIVVYSARYIYSLLLPNIILLRRFMAFLYHLYLDFLLSATINNCKTFREEILGNQRFCVDRRQKNLFAHKGRTNRNKTVVSSRKLHGEPRKVALVKLTSISETREGEVFALNTGSRAANVCTQRVLLAHVYAIQDALSQVIAQVASTLVHRSTALCIVPRSGVTPR